MTLYDNYQVTAGESTAFLGDWSGSGGGSPSDVPGIAQTFTPVVSYLITQIDMRIKKVSTPTGIMTLEIRECDSVTGLPKTDVLATESLDTSTLSTSYAWVTLGDFGNLTLSSGQEYAIICTYPDDTLAGTPGTDIAFSYQASDVYSRGKILSQVKNGTSETFGTGILGTGDAIFRVYGQVWNSNIVQYSTILAKIGSGANATSKNYDYANNYVQVAEGYVAAVTRYDWGGNWTSLHEKARRVVEQAVACLAAIDIIQYDYSGYGTRFEAREKCAELRELANIAIDALKDENVKVFVQTP